MHVFELTASEYTIWSWKWFRSHSLSPMSCLVHCLLLRLGQWFCRMMSLLNVCIVKEVSKGQCCDASTNMGCSLCHRRRKTGISAPDVNFLFPVYPSQTPHYSPWPVEGAAGGVKCSGRVHCNSHTVGTGGWKIKLWDWGTLWFTLQNIGQFFPPLHLYFPLLVSLPVHGQWGKLKV